GGSRMPPPLQELQPALLAHRAHLRPAAVARVAVDARQQPPRAPLLTAPVLEAPADREAARAKRLQRDVHRAGRQAAAGAQLVDREWPRHVEMALDERNLHLVRGALLGR